MSGPTVGPTTITSTYTLGSNLEVAEQISHAAGSSFVDLHYEITNTSGVPVSFRAGELSDLYVAGSDDGAGVFEIGPPRFVGGRSETGVTSGLVESTPWTHFQAGDFGDVFSKFATPSSTTRSIPSSGTTGSVRSGRSLPSRRAQRGPSTSAGDSSRAGP